MKLLKSTTLIIMLLISVIVFAQKIKVKKGIASIDKNPICKLQKDDISRGAFYINSLDDEELIYAKWIDWGEFGYFEVYDAKNLDEVLFETEASIGYRKWLIKTLYNGKALTNSGLNEEKLEVIAKKLGREFTRKRNRY
ncbi:hypothetical protein ACFQ1Q_10680 [Winogradskyella litorisediminis]|uniref:Uncharacterized protein n=1 Tax=Winogradskyella litorisediminis TaxID=1156618 RepID=A0ABW3NB54_9FLAO